MITAEVVHATRANVHKYGCAVIERAIAFSEEHELDSDPQTLWATLAGSMVNLQPSMLCIAAVEDGEVVGHLTASLLNFHGTIGVFVESLGIDAPRREGREQTMKDGFEEIIAWGRSNNATFIRAWAMNEKLVSVFNRFGLKEKPYRLIETKIDGGE